MTVPAGAIGWLYLDINHALNGPPKGMEPFPNVIWVYRENDGGLRLMHSGPDKQGVYASVSKSGEMTFGDKEGIQKPAAGQAYNWVLFSTEDHTPALLPEEDTFRPVASAPGPPKYFVDRSGCWMQGPGIETE